MRSTSRSTRTAIGDLRSFRERIAGLRDHRGRAEFTELSEFNAWAARLSGRVHWVPHHGVVVQVTRAKGVVGPVVESERIRRFREWCIAVMREAAETEEKQDKGAA